MIFLQSYILFFWRATFESNVPSDFLTKEDWIRQDIHCVPSLVKLFFRELPEPLCSRKTLPLLKKAASVGALNSDSRESMPYFKAALGLMTKPQYWWEICMSCCSDICRHLVCDLSVITFIWTTYNVDTLDQAFEIATNRQNHLGFGFWVLTI